MTASYLKKFLSLVKHWRHLKTPVDINHALKAHAPFSAGSAALIARHTLASANETFPLIDQLQVQVTGYQLEIKDVTDFCKTSELANQAEELANLFQKYGSDKASPHRYHFLYAALLAPLREVPLNLLEIGLGTQNKEIASHMTSRSKVGGSLRVFREFLKQADIYGADVDRDILFSEERIQTFYLDQTDSSSFADAAKRLKNKKFDFVIDDGLHAPYANLQTLMFALEILKPGGYLVIEDIKENSLPVWNVVGGILSKQHEVYLVRGKRTYLFVLQMSI